MFTEKDYHSLPSVCPGYVNKAFQIPSFDGLPQGVYESCGIYYCVVFHGEYWSPRFEQPFDCPYFAHKHFQGYYVQSMRQLLQYYSMSEYYNQAMAKGIRLMVDRIEDDLNNNRESVI